MTSRGAVEEGSAWLRDEVESELAPPKLGGAAARWSAFHRRYLSSEDWTIGLVGRTSSRAIAERSVGEIEWMPTPRGYKWLADPFSFEHRGVSYLVCEGMRRLEDKGHLVIGTIADFRAGRVQTLAEEPYHLSYPFLFSWVGRHYCIPETHQTREVKLYELVTDEGRWRLSPRACLVRDTALCDPTLVHHAGRFWLFATGMAADGNRDLFLYVSDRLEGPFVPHRGNPVKRDLAGARPAGTPFQFAGQLIRPAQDCSREYGKAILLQRVERLSETAFAESCIATLEPPAGCELPAGIHTINSVGPSECVIDGKMVRSIFRPTSLVNRYGASFSRRWHDAFREE